MADCLTCKYREQLGNTQRSMCCHPLLKKINDAVDLNYKLGYRGYPLPIKVKSKASEYYFVRFSQLGVRFKAVGWPYNFDPAFLLFCAGYKEKNEKQ